MPTRLFVRQPKIYGNCHVNGDRLALASARREAPVLDRGQRLFIQAKAERSGEPHVPCYALLCDGAGKPDGAFESGRASFFGILGFRFLQKLRWDHDIAELIHGRERGQRWGSGCVRWIPNDGLRRQLILVQRSVSLASEFEDRA